MNKKEETITKTRKAKSSTKTNVESKNKTTAQNKKEVNVKHTATKAITKIEGKKIYATGKRKTAIAKVWMISKGSGKIIVNGKNLIDYFQRPVDRMIINQPFAIVKAEGIYDIECNVLGSGLSGQAGAVRHGISKALNQISDEFHKTLRSGGFLTRDSRKVERKKYGQPKARKKFQFSKR